MRGRVIPTPGKTRLDKLSARHVATLPREKAGEGLSPATAVTLGRFVSYTMTGSDPPPSGSTPPPGGTCEPPPGLLPPSVGSSLPPLGGTAPPPPALGRFGAAEWHFVF